MTIIRVFSVLLILALICGCTDVVFLQGSLSVQSDPGSAEIYLDSEYKGTTPAIIHGIGPGPHYLELRHARYPAWTQNVSIIPGQTLDIVADLSENLVPSVTAECIPPVNSSSVSYESTCIYSPGDKILLSGDAVWPLRRTERNVTLLIRNTDNESDPVQQFYAPINLDFSYNFTIPAGSLDHGSYRITATLPDGTKAETGILVESPADKNLRTLRSILKEYYSTHTYNQSDFFVCADMALDVWNMVRTKGMQAKIAAGNIENSSVKINEYNHAWVLAEYSSGSWIALETTTGYLVPNNSAYYKGVFFGTPRDFKTYINLMQDYNDEVYRISNMTRSYNEKVALYNPEVDLLNSRLSIYNSQYVDRDLSYEEYVAGLALKNQIDSQKLAITKMKGELGQLLISIEAEQTALAGIRTQMETLIEKGKSL